MALIADAAVDVPPRTMDSIRASSTPHRCRGAFVDSAHRGPPAWLRLFCTRVDARDARGHQDDDQESSKTTESVDEDEGIDEATDSADSDAAKANAKKKEDEVIKVKVSVAKGKTAWIEVKVDGKSVFGAQATGPFEQEYTPESSIEITTSKPSDVTVTKNGEKVRYDTKTSGVARVTITVPKKETTDSEDGESADGTDTADGTDAQSTDGTDAQSTDGTDTASDGQTANDSDDYSYDSY